MHCVTKAFVEVFSRFVGGRTAVFVYNYGTIPGVVHHECAHALLGLVTGAKITEFAPFKPELESGSLGHVGIAPRGNFILRAIQKYFSASAPCLLGPLSSYFLLMLIRSRDWGVPVLVVLWYLLVSIILHSTMSSADVKQMVMGMLPIYILLALVCVVLGITPSEVFDVIREVFVL